MEFGFTRKDKIAFYWKYFASKVFYLWFEVKKPRFRMFLYEMLYSGYKFIDPSSLLPSPFKTNLVETKFGKFRIRPGTADMSNVSPAFERRDIDYLLQSIQRLTSKNKKILFLDIGADLGTYSITVGNRFKNYDNITIMAFEPAKSSHDLLMKNINLNSLEGKVVVCDFALYSEDNKEIEFHFNELAPGTSGLTPSGVERTQKVFTRTLNSVIADRVEDYDAILFKIDVEGVEADVLRGADRILEIGKDNYLLVEDFINPEIVNHLQNIGAEFICKLTPYNSWWKITIAGDKGSRTPLSSD